MMPITTLLLCRSIPAITFAIGRLSVECCCLILFANDNSLTARRSPLSMRSKYSRANYSKQDEKEISSRRHFRRCGAGHDWVWKKIRGSRERKTTHLCNGAKGRTPLLRAVLRRIQGCRWQVRSKGRVSRGQGLRGATAG